MVGGADCPASRRTPPPYRARAPEDRKPSAKGLRSAKDLRSAPVGVSGRGPPLMGGHRPSWRVSRRSWGRSLLRRGSVGRSAVSSAGYADPGPEQTVTESRNVEIPQANASGPNAHQLSVVETLNPANSSVGSALGRNSGGRVKGTRKLGLMAALRVCSAKPFGTHP